MLLLAGGVGLVAFVVLRGHRDPSAGGPAASADRVLEGVATRAGLAPERLTIERLGKGGDAWVSVTIHAPRRFDVARFVLDLEAAAHNTGGRLEPRALTEKGGYGLAALEGTAAGQRIRVVVLGEEPPARAAPPPASRPREGRLAIVLDDAGYSLEAVDAIRELPQEIAVAVLPNAPYSNRVAAALIAQRREVLLHMPMEALPNPGPGPGEGAITVGLPPPEIAARLNWALGVVGMVKGVNNHMGSRATADEETMRAFMADLRGRGLYFLDSRTTPDTVAEREALANAVPATHRDVFLDVVSEAPAIRRALAAAVHRARTAGSAVAIGHVHPVTLKVLAEERDGLLKQVVLVPPSQLVVRR